MKQELFATRRFIFVYTLIWVVAFGALIPLSANGVNACSVIIQKPQETNSRLPQSPVIQDSLKVVTPGKNGVVISNLQSPDLRK